MGTSVGSIMFDKLFAYYDEMEVKIAACKWYEFLKRRALKVELQNTRIEAAVIGIKMAIVELAEAGIVKLTP